jgi:hypothetical protein
VSVRASTLKFRKDEGENDNRVDGSKPYGINLTLITLLLLLAFCEADHRGMWSVTTACRCNDRGLAAYVDVQLKPTHRSSRSRDNRMQTCASKLANVVDDLLIKQQHAGCCHAHLLLAAVVDICDSCKVSSCIANTSSSCCNASRAESSIAQQQQHAALGMQGLHQLHQFPLAFQLKTHTQLLHWVHKCCTLLSAWPATLCLSSSSSPCPACCTAQLRAGHSSTSRSTHQGCCWHNCSAGGRQVWADIT